MIATLVIQCNEIGAIPIVRLVRGQSCGIDWPAMIIMLLWSVQLLVDVGVMIPITMYGLV